MAEVCSKEIAVGVSDVTNEAPLKIAKTIADAADDAKGKEVVLLDVSKNFGLADYFVIASARSDRHCQGIANKIISQLSEIGIEPYSVQGIEDGQWVIVDCGDVVMHIFYEPLRQRYDLESLWLDAKTVDRAKLDGTKVSRANSPTTKVRQREAVLA